MPGEYESEFYPSGRLAFRSVARLSLVPRRGSSCL